MTSSPGDPTDIRDMVYDFDGIVGVGFKYYLVNGGLQIWDGSAWMPSYMCQSDCNP